MTVPRQDSHSPLFPFSPHGLLRGQRPALGMQIQARNMSCLCRTPMLSPDSLPKTWPHGAQLGGHGY